MGLAGEFSGPSLKRGAHSGPSVDDLGLAGEFSGPSLKLGVCRPIRRRSASVWPENSPALH